MSTHLYLIGNGFDLHHNINSSYLAFRGWMYENNPDIMNDVENIYGYCDKNWWSDFENQLASLDVIRFGEEIAFENQPDLMSEHCDRTWNDAEIEVEQKLEALYSDIRACFHDWIMQLNRPDAVKMVKIDTNDSIFINFNYTKTLEDLYGISPSKILHIHGCIDCDEDFILGHCKSYEELAKTNSVTLSEPPENITSEELEQFYEDEANKGQELHEQLATDAAIRGVASQQKPVAKLMKKYSSFFESIKDVDHVHVYGLSLSEVDLPYLEYFASKFKDSHWEFNDYKGNDVAKINNFCRLNSLDHYSIISLEDIQYVRQLRLDF